jgi:hypothetical protein
MEDPDASIQQIFAALVADEQWNVLVLADAF